MLKARLLEYWEGIAYPSGEPELTSGFSGARVAQSLVFCVVFVARCLSICLFTIVLSVLRFTASDYPFVSSNIS